jgi:TolB-like protein/Tfp pilus assembly protein PilF
MKIDDFFSELKRRNVYKVAVAYAVVAWLLIQAASILFPTFEAPPWVMKVFVAVIVLGFPMALVFSWAFEITPEGIRREEDISPDESITRHTGRKIIGIIIVVAAVATGLFVFQLFRPRLTSLNRSPATTVSATPEKSIAVLPFENLSSDKENAYFTDGVQDEILTDLARVADIKVISRTSVMQYRDAAARNLRKIGEELGVAHLLEGSVQRAANKIRVNAQLIDARTDAHLWAQTYDRDLADVFAIQSEIAQRIAEQLQAKLSPNEQKAIEQVPTTDLVAHDLYLRARALDDLVNDPSGRTFLQQAVQLLEEAIKRDPNFLLAHCLLAEVHTDLYWGGFDHTDARLEQARAALEKAEHIRPDAGEVHAMKGTFAYHGHRDYETARREFEIARRTLPNSARLALITGAVDRRQGRWDEAVKNFTRAVELDPRDSVSLEEAAFTFARMRRYAEARPFLERATTVNPNDLYAQAILWSLPYRENADTSTFRAGFDELARVDPGDASRIASAYLDCALAERDRAEAEQVLRLIPADGSVDNTLNNHWPRRNFDDKIGAQKAFAAARPSAVQTTKDQPEYPAGWLVLGMIDAGLGDKTNAMAEAERVRELTPISKDAFDGPYYANYLAQMYAWLGEKDLAFEQLTLSANNPAGVSYGDLKLSPNWDSLRGDPRFEKIVASLAPKK